MCFVGLIKEVNGDYKDCFLFSGISILTSGLIILVHALFRMQNFKKILTKIKTVHHKKVPVLETFIPDNPNVQPELVKLSEPAYESDIVS